MAGDQPASGRVKSALVVGDGDDVKAVISSVVARVCTEMAGPRVKFTGSVLFDESSAERIADVLVPIVDRVLEGLGLARRSFEIAVVNLARASAVDIGSRLSGFSADVAVLLAMVSAGLQMPVLDDLVSTGHVASPDGDIRAVKAIPAKLVAAERESTVRRFVHPALDRDFSLEILSPGEHQRAMDAIANSYDRLKTISVGDVSELVQAVFEDEAIVLASLRQDFFNVVSAIDLGSDPVGRVVHYLGTKNEDRFWTVLERRLLDGEADEVKVLLDARVQFHIRHQTYPEGFGHRLLQLVQSLPPGIRRLKALLPLMPMQSCIQIGQYTTDRDGNDLRQLIDAVSGRFARPKATEMGGTSHADLGDTAGATLDTILAQIDATGLARTVGLPIDSARASYVMDTATVESYEEFVDSVCAFHLHLLRHVRGAVAPNTSDATCAEALALLERAFAKRGGLEAAFAEARDGPQGGMRYILDSLTEQFKNEEKAKHVSRVFKEALDPLDWKAKVALIATLLQRLNPVLPENIRSAPPERFARRWETLVQAHVASLDQIKNVLRTL